MTARVDHPRPEPISTQLRRRREAALRCPPYNDRGDRDPLAVSIEAKPWGWLAEHPTRDVVLVTGTPRSRIANVLQVADVYDQARWSDSGGGWVIPASRAGDVEAAFTVAGVPYRWRRRRRGKTP